MIKAAKLDILKMDKAQLLTLSYKDIQHFLTPEEIVHIAKALGAFWSYDYRAAKNGKVGLHAELKSGLHSDCFFVSRILLEYENIRRIITDQMSMLILHNIQSPYIIDSVAGVPDGATIIGEDISSFLGVKCVKMKKVDERIRLTSNIKPGESVLVVEDICTRGTGFTEAVRAIWAVQPDARIIPYDPVIINRGGLDKIQMDGICKFEVLPIVKLDANDWSPDSCPLCQKGSVAIKPKATDENWEKITTSQVLV
jgi:orotate phosphoribosyltransferase